VVTGGLPPLGVVVDLDDTLYPQAEYLAGAAAAVGAAAGVRGLDGAAVHAALAAELAAVTRTWVRIDANNPLDATEMGQRWQQPQAM
jgi:putative hydrolase of the HAD superfamily